MILLTCWFCLLLGFVFGALWRANRYRQAEKWEAEERAFQEAVRKEMEFEGRMKNHE